MSFGPGDILALSLVIAYYNVANVISSFICAGMPYCSLTACKSSHTSLMSLLSYLYLLAKVFAAYFHVTQPVSLPLLHLFIT